MAFIKALEEFSNGFKDKSVHVAHHLFNGPKEFWRKWSCIFCGREIRALDTLKYCNHSMGTRSVSGMHRHMARMISDVPAGVEYITALRGGLHRAGTYL